MAHKYSSQAGVAGLLSLVPHVHYFTGKPGASGFGSASTAEQACQGWDGSGKVVVITGASSGLGAESARVLAARGSTCVLFVRNLQAADKVIQSIKQIAPSADVRVIQCDLEDLSSVAKAAHDFLAMRLPLHVLMLNAGVMAPPFKTTMQGLELQMGVNHVANALLARLLLPCIAKTASAPGAPQGRIVCVSSTSHMFTPSNPFSSMDRVNQPQGYNPFLQYGLSKLANILFTRELTERLKAAGVQNVAAVLAYPGIIPGTQASRHHSYLGWMAAPFRFMFKTVPQGAMTQVYLATAPGQLPSGEMFHECQPMPTAFTAHDAQLGKKLWDWTMQQLQPFLDPSVEARQPVTWQ